MTPNGTGEGFLARTGGPAFAAAAGALRAAFGRDVVHYGQGGSIPLVAALERIVPGAELILWGAEEPLCKIHAPDESVDLGELQRMVLAEALFLADARRLTAHLLWRILCVRSECERVGRRGEVSELA